MISTAVAISLLFTLFSSIQSNEPEVKLKFGNIQGFKETIDGTDVSVFLGISYAEPPVGSRRFRKPQPKTKKQSGVLKATKWPKICMQNTLFFQYFNSVSEDCLYLNIWTPVNLNEDFSQKLKPVMVYIHGGGFTYMTSSYKHYNGAVLSSFGDIIVVTMNYRLGAFGFLFSGSDDAPGNVGLYDQALALEWVQENIAYFGGDPNKVTLVGQSAGAWALTLHLLSPVSQDSFSRAIIMSGVSFRGVSTDRKDVAIRKTLELVRLLGCQVDESESHVNSTHMECLRNANAAKIVDQQTSTQISMYSKSLTKLPFVPLIGEGFVPKSPKQAIEQMALNEGVELLIGTTANEGYIMHFAMQNHGLLPKGNNWREKLRYFVNNSFRNLSSEAIDEIIDFYFNQTNNEAKLSYYTALGDIHFNCEMIYFLNLVYPVNDLYQYLFDYQLVNNDDNVEYCDLHQACHGNELPITFGTVSNARDMNVSKKWMQIVTGFVKTGAVNWPKHGRYSKPYFKFTGKKNDRLFYNFRDKACKLWKPIFDNNF